LHEITKRNVIVYYSGWLQKRGVQGAEINDEDKNGFMTVIHELDRNLGLDLVLHTPGGDTAATESLVHYLRAMFGTDIRAVVPQLAMSGGTMIACACKKIIMGKQSSLGPVDPQLGGVPAHGVVEEFVFV
jgi:ClpP class serine protease